jgi:type IV pilus assembly protein PilE
MRRQSGFSLIELMAVVAIIGILAAIAFPSYNSYVLRSNRATGKTKVMEVVAKQESWFNDRKGYSASLVDLGFIPSGTTLYLKKNGNVENATSTDAIYSIQLATYGAVSPTGSCGMSGAPTALQYVVVATPINQQTKDTGCGKLCYSHLGEKGVSGTSTDCWNR